MEGNPICLGRAYFKKEGHADHFRVGWQGYRGGKSDFDELNHLCFWGGWNGI